MWNDPSARRRRPDIDALEDRTLLSYFDFPAGPILPAAGWVVTEYVIVTPGRGHWNDAVGHGFHPDHGPGPGGPDGGPHGLFAPFRGGNFGDPGRPFWGGPPFGDPPGRGLMLGGAEPAGDVNAPSDSAATRFATSTSPAGGESQPSGGIHASSMTSDRAAGGSGGPVGPFSAGGPGRSGEPGGGNPSFNPAVSQGPHSAAFNTGAESPPPGGGPPGGSTAVTAVASASNPAPAVAPGIVNVVAPPASNATAAPVTVAVPTSVAGLPPSGVPATASPRTVALSADGVATAPWGSGTAPTAEVRAELVQADANAPAPGPAPNAAPDPNANESAADPALDAVAPSAAADFMTGFLPFDRANLEISLQRFLDQLEGATESTAPPAAPWPRALVVVSAGLALEAARRWHARRGITPRRDWRQHPSALSGLS